MTSITNANPVLQEQIRNLVAQGNTPDALRLLVEAGYKPANLMQKQLEFSTAHFASRRITYQDWAMVQNRINYAILQVFEAEYKAAGNPFAANMGENRTLEASKPFGPVPKARIQALLEQHQMEEAIELCRNLGDDYFHLKARYHDLKKHHNLGLVSDTELALTLAHMTYAIFSFLSEAPDEAADGLSQTSDRGE